MWRNLFQSSEEAYTVKITSVSVGIDKSQSRGPCILVRSTEGQDAALFDLIPGGLRGTSRIMRWPSPPALLPLLSQVSQVSRDFHPILYFCSLNSTGIEITGTAGTLGQAQSSRPPPERSLPSMLDHLRTTQPALIYFWLSAFCTRFSMCLQCEALCFVRVIRSRSWQ